MATGVVKLDGISEVKMVALEGDMRYFAWSWASKASLKPRMWTKRLAIYRIRRSREMSSTFYLASVT